MFVAKEIGLDLGFGTVAGERRWAGEVADGCGDGDGRRCGGDVFPLDVFVFILIFWFLFNLDIFVEVCETPAERAGKGRGVLLEEWTYAFVVESVGAGCNKERLAYGNRK